MFKPFFTSAYKNKIYIRGMFDDTIVQICLDTNKDHLVSGRLYIQEKGKPSNIPVASHFNPFIYNMLDKLLESLPEQFREHAAEFRKYARYEFAKHYYIKKQIKQEKLLQSD